MSSTHLVSALGAEFRAALHFRPAASALVLRTQRLAAFGTEFRALRSRPASGAKRHRLASQIHILGQVLGAQLLAHLIDLGLHLGGRQLRIDVWRACVTKGPLSIPASRLTHPLRAFWTLPEIRFGLVDGGAVSLIVGGTKDRALDLVRIGACLP